MQWYLEVLKKYAVFDGRAHRTEFWMFVLVSLIISVILAVLDFILGTNGAGSGLLQGLYSLAVLVPSLAVGARRTARHRPVGLVAASGADPPDRGAIVLIVWFAQKGDPSPNEHGPNPWDGPQPV